MCALSLGLGLVACRDRAPADSPGTVTVEAKALPPTARDVALARARVWAPPPIPIEKADFSANTPGPGAFNANGDVDCTFSAEAVDGSTPKFICVLPSGEHVKVKYGAANGELPAEVAATRLLAGLGFPTDRVNRVRSVRCRGCPMMPQEALQCLGHGGAAQICMGGASGGSVVTFRPAVIERPLEGKKIQEQHDQGWAWYELDRIDAKAGGSTRAEIDALRLIAIIFAHWDNKGANQKLLCPPGAQPPGDVCRTPIAAIGDLGSTFGPLRVDLQNWKSLPVWADAHICRVSMKSLPFHGATFPDAQISEEGRQFALRLLRRLSREQLNALFESSGVTAFPHVLAEAHTASGWTDAFLDKVQQIESAGPCSSKP